MLRMGLTKGDSMLVVMGREVAWYGVMLGCCKLGVISMPGTQLLTAEDIAFRIRQAGAKAVAVSPKHCEKVEAIRGKCPTLQHLICVDEAEDAPTLPLGWLSYRTLCAGESPTLERAEADAAGCGTSEIDTMLTYFTSGTTGPPKNVPRDFAYAHAHAATALYWMSLQEGDVHWTLTDPGWAKAAWGILCPQMLAGATIVLYDPPAFDAKAHLDLIGRLSVRTFCAPPTVYRLFVQEDLGAFELGSLRRCLSAGEPLNPEVLRTWKRYTGTTVADGYGQTETINVLGNFEGLPVKPGSVGMPVPGFDVDVVSDDGCRLAPEEVGHVAIRTEGRPWPPGLFRGYVREDGSLDQKPFRNGWYYTGDMARRDAEGYFWFEGRADDIITSSAYRISPFEVESALLEHPAVQESAVIGVPDPLRTELVKAYVILAAGFDASPELAAELQEFCKQQTAPYKYPRLVEFVAELPKTISGKIRRVQLREAEVAAK